MTKPPKTIPFYGAQAPDLFAIERRAMDRDGHLIAHLGRLLPCGPILDIGAGNGFTAARLQRPDRPIIPLEPARGMIGTPSLPWVQGLAQELPFTTNSFAAAYATWAYFFPSFHNYGNAGLEQVRAAVRPGGPIAIADNAGDDAFCALFQRNIASDPSWWARQGFTRQIVHTAFKFSNLEEAERLLSFYWQNNGRSPGASTQLEIDYKIAVYVRQND